MNIVSAIPTPIPNEPFEKVSEVNVRFQDGTEKYLFTFYPNEILFTEEEFVGLTEDEAFKLRLARIQENASL